MLNADSRSMQLLAVAALAVFWGVNWPIMKIALEAVEPWTFRALLAMSGAAGCLALLPLTGGSWRLPRADWPMLCWLALFQGVLWHGLSGFGIWLIDAGRAAIIAFTMPVWATLFSVIFLKEHVSPRRIAGLACGMAGMLLLLLPAVQALAGQLLGTLLMLGAAISWGAAAVIFKAGRWQGPVIAITAWQFILGSVPLTLAAILLGRPSSLLELDTRTGLALLYAATIPMVICQIIWFSVIRRLPASLASMSTLMVPVIGVLSSALMLGERIGPLDLTALLLVIGAMSLILPGISSPASRRPPPASRPE